MTAQLSYKYMDQLESWIGTRPKFFALLYKITTDGCNATTFHQKCDNKGPTVTVLYNQHGSVFGGYGGASWNSIGGGIPDANGGSFIKDTNAFLFQLKYSGSDHFIKFSVTKPDSAMYASPSFGPIFGGGYDLITFCGTVNNSGGYFDLNGSVNIGHSFNNHGLSFDQVNNGNMQVIELDVYSVTDGPRIRTPQQPPQPPQPPQPLQPPQPSQPCRKTPELNEKDNEKLDKQELLEKGGDQE